MLIIETAFVALCVGILAFAPPPIVGGMGAIPDWAKYIVGIIAFLLAAWQIVGLVTVITDTPWAYKQYSRVTFLGTVVILCFTIAFTVTAAAKHDDAIQACLAEFGQPLANDGYGVQEVQSHLDDGRRDVCNYLGWADVGLMGGLVVVVGLLQLYMCFMQGQYGKRQRAAQKEALTPPDPGAYSMRSTNTWNAPGHGTTGLPDMQHRKYQPVMQQDMPRNEPLYNTYAN